MTKSILSETNFELLVSRVAHSLTLIKQKELAKYHIAPRQHYVLHIINALGDKATAPEVARIVHREVNVIARLVVNLENDGFIKRVKNKPKSNLLSLKLTKKGMDLIKINPMSPSVDRVLSTLSREEYEQMDSTLMKIEKMFEELRRSL